MPHMLLYDQCKGEISVIRDQLAAIKSGSEELSFFSAETLQELVKCVNEIDDISLYCSDFDAGGETAVRIVRDSNPDALIVIIVESSVSPLQYVRPSIIASGLLLRPFSQEQVFVMLKEVVDEVWAKEREKLTRNDVFTFSTREGTIRVPYSKILFFEARNKKVVLCTLRTEQSFYITLENLMTRIPHYFIRCHKGFIVNKLFVDVIDLNQNQLHLLGGFTIPVSRSYRASVKEALI